MSTGWSWLSSWTNGTNQSTPGASHAGRDGRVERAGGPVEELLDRAVDADDDDARHVEPAAAPLARCPRRACRRPQGCRGRSSPAPTTSTSYSVPAWLLAAICVPPPPARGPGRTPTRIGHRQKKRRARLAISDAILMLPASLIWASRSASSTLRTVSRMILGAAAIGREDDRAP